MKKLIIALLSISMLAALAGCGDTNNGNNGQKPESELDKAERERKERAEVADQEAEKNKADIQKLAKTYSDIGAAAYGNALTKAEGLQTAVHELAKVALATTDLSDATQKNALKDALDAARTAWVDSRYPYLQTEVYRFYDGPINQFNPYYDPKMSEQTEIEPLVNAWPMDESFLDYTCKYSGMPGPDAPKEKGDHYRCNPLHMKFYADCRKNDTNKGTLSNDLWEKAKANNCYLPETNPDITPSGPYSATNMTTYQASFIGAGSYDPSNATKTDGQAENKKKILDLVTTYHVAEQKYSLLSADQKKKLQLAIRGYGGGDPVAGQEYGDGDEEDPNAPHHVSQGEANVSTGYHAIEFLLWGQDFDPSGPGSRPLTDYTPNLTTGTPEPNAARRLIYLQAITDMLVEDIKYVAGQWKDGEDNYRKEFMGWASSDPRKVVDKIFAGMSNLSVNETGGERIQPALKFHNQEEEHSCFSDNTQADMQYDIQGIVNVWLGSYTPHDPALAGTGVASGTGMKVILGKFANLCKNDKFKDQTYCKTNGQGYVDTEKLGEGLQKALGLAKNLTDNNPGSQSFDQEVSEVWPIWPKSAQQPNPGYKKLSALGTALSDLGPWYNAFSYILSPETTTTPE